MQSTESDQSSEVQAIRERFSEISIIKLIFVLVAVMVAVAVVFGVTSAGLDSVGLELGFFWEEFLDASAYMAMLGALVVLYRKKHLSFSPIFRRRGCPLHDLVIVVPMIVFSISAMWVSVLGLNLISAEFAQTYLDFIDRSASFATPGPESPAHYYLILFVTIAVLPPLLEEVVFRAGMIERLGRKFGFKVGVILSAVLFGLLHPFDVLGATLFGIVLGLLYLKTLSLFLPILVHVINNGLVVLLIFLDEQFLDLPSWDTPEQYGYPWLALGLLLLSSMWIYRFIRQNWHVVSERKPI